MTKEEYKKISQNLISIMKKLIQDNPNTKVVVDLLSLHLVEQQVNDFQDHQQMERFNKVVRGVIKRMADKEKIFQIIEDETGSEIVRFHPSATF